MTVTAESLVAAGYRRYRNHMNTADTAPWLFQKSIDDDHGTRYFVDVIQYDWVAFPDACPDRYTYQAEVHFYKAEQSDCRIICLSHDDTQSTISLEAYFARMWKVMEMGYYERSA